mmetsp:Transcript_8493/g.13187  ORF Transcript_8493/g.13187 Transcript_8493/m.13187 type:complete len:256 (+) Transcript_8493:137-904(+)
MNLISTVLIIHCPSISHFSLLGGSAPVSIPTSRTSIINPAPIPIQTGIIVCVSLTSEEVAEHSSQVSNIRLSFKLETAAICEILSKLGRTSLTQGRDGDRLFLLHDEFVFLRGGFGLESLPGEPSLEEIDEDISNTFKIVTTRLFNPQMVINGSITRCTGKRSTFTLRNVLKGTGVPIPLGKSEINAVDEISAAASSIGDEVSWLNITMDKVAGVHELHTLQHLIRNHEDSFEGESTAAFVELILERWTKEVHNH